MHSPPRRKFINPLQNLPIKIHIFLIYYSQKEREVREMKNFVIFLIVALLIVGSIIATVAILNSDMPDIWKWFLLK